MSEKNSIVVVYDSHTEAEAGVKELQKAGFDMKKLSIIGKEYHTEEHIVGYYNAGDRMKYWGKMGAFWGGLWGFLFGAAFLVIPGIGPFLVGGPVVACVGPVFDDSVGIGGRGVVGGGVYRIGSASGRLIRYETPLKAD